MFIGTHCISKQDVYFGKTETKTDAKSAIKLADAPRNQSPDHQSKIRTKPDAKTTINANKENCFETADKINDFISTIHQVKNCFKYNK